MEVRVGAQFKTALPGDEKCVAMCVHDDHVFIATTSSVYELVDGVMVAIPFCIPEAEEVKE